ncbi:MAG: hypothetical protein KY476_22035 [Planctomycetes bacterium]|nr:hypothetical protein [Planctomycetota bacterium]
MLNLRFEILDAGPLPFAAAPHLVFKLKIAADERTPIESILLHSQIRIEPTRRGHEGEDAGRLFDLFGPPERWGRTMRGLLWTQADVTVPPFTGETTADLSVLCTSDLSIAAARYFDALQSGDVPLAMLFTGSVFYRDDQGALQIGRIPWDREATYRLPLAVWKELMQTYYPHTAWLSLDKELVDRLARYKSRRGLLNLDQALECLLNDADRVTAVSRQ